MSAITTTVVPAEKAAQIDKIFEGLVAIRLSTGDVLRRIRDGIVLHCVFKKYSTVAQGYCLAARSCLADAMTLSV